MELMRSHMVRLELKKLPDPLLPLTKYPESDTIARDRLPTTMTSVVSSFSLLLYVLNKHVMGKPTSTYWDSLTGFLQNVIFQEMFNGSFPQRPRFDRWGVYRTFKIN